MAAAGMTDDESEILAPEPVTAGELFASACLDEDKPVMLRVRGEVFPCEPPSIVWHEGRYVLMLDGVTRG